MFNPMSIWSIYPFWLMEIVDTEGQIKLSLRNAVRAPGYQAELLNNFVVNIIAGGLILTEHESAINVNGEELLMLSGGSNLNHIISSL
jgi:hypothetical protein